MREILTSGSVGDWSSNRRFYPDTRPGMAFARQYKVNVIRRHSRRVILVVL